MTDQTSPAENQNIFLIIGDHTAQLRNHEQWLQKHDVQISQLAQLGSDTQRTLDKLNTESEARDQKQAARIDALICRMDEDAKTRAEEEKERHENIAAMVERNDRTMGAIGNILKPLLIGVLTLILTTLLSHTGAEHNETVNLLTPVALGVVALLCLVYVALWFKGKSISH